MTRTAQECPWAERTVFLALHALEPDQEARATDHVRSCPACRATIREADETFAAIGETAATAPPPELRHRILAVVEQDTPPVAPVPIGSGRTAGHAPRRTRRWAVAAAAAVLVAGMAGAGIVVSQLGSQRDAATVHAATVDDLLAAVTASPHAVLVDRDRHPVAAVALGDAPRFYVLDLPPAPAGRTWVLWGARGQDATALAAVPAGSNGVASPVGRLGDYEAYLITQEPPGPLPARPSEVRASGPVVSAS